MGCTSRGTLCYLLIWLAGWRTGFTMTAKVAEDDHKQMFVGLCMVNCELSVVPF